jgi:TonB-dependent receptor
MRSLRHSMNTPFRLAALAAACLLPVAAFAATGSLSGTVTNAALRNALAGATVELPALQRSTLTDATGRYVFADVPAGTHEVVATYLGLDSGRATIAVIAGQPVRRDFDLSAAIYQLDAFKVTGEREGDAAAITAQRNSLNLKNVTATDSFGNLPNYTIGEVVVRLPGVVSDADAGGGFTVGSIRGVSLNTYTFDGGQITSQGALGRGGALNTMSGTLFESVELIKGHTPESGADSLGGTINFKTRSALSMREKRRVTYNLSARFVPPSTKQIPMRHEHRAHQLVNLGYQEVFDVGRGERNLGVTLNLSQSEQARGWFNTVRDHQNTAASPAYLWDYRTQDTFNHRRQWNGLLKFDYRWSPATKLSFSVTAVDHSEVYRRQFDTRAFTNQVVFNPDLPATNTANAGAGIAPGFTDLVTTVRAVPASIIDITTQGPNFFFNRQRRASLGGEHEWDRWSVDWSGIYSQTHINIGQGENGATLTNRITNVGWVLDRTSSDIRPRFTQTGLTPANDFTNPANYRPNGPMTNGNSSNDHVIAEARGNVRYRLPWRAPIFAKTGFHYRHQWVDESSLSRRWNYTGTTALPASTALLMSDTIETGRRLPVWEAADVIRARLPITPSLWQEDGYYHTSNIFIADRSVAEAVTSGYVQAQGKLADSGFLGRTGFLAGVRMEDTKTESRGYVRARIASSNALRLTDPVEAARQDYAGTQRELRGGFSKAFPSVHLTHDLTRNVKARVSWSNSYGKPSMANLLPNETASTDAEGNSILTINNPSLRPQLSENWDLDLDWYFEPVGNLSIAWFHKTIKDYIVTGIEGPTIGSGTDNGYNGDYVGFLTRTSGNAGYAIVQGWELVWLQQFTFLPGLLRGLSGTVNYTYLDTRGDFGGATVRRTGQVPGFTPHSGNASLTWRWRGFSVRYLVNYSGERITAFNATAAHRNTYRVARTVENLGFAYQFNPRFSVTCDIDNLSNEPIVSYRGTRDRISSASYYGLAVTVGVAGRF